MSLYMYKLLWKGKINHKDYGSILSLLLIIDLCMEMSMIDDMPRIDEN